MSNDFIAGGHKLTILKPTAQQHEDATMEYNRVFSKALQNGALLREKLETYMRQQNLWDDEKEREYNNLLTHLNKCDLQLQKGGIKISEARDIALDMGKTRVKLQELISDKNALDVNTAQGQGENARFNYLFTCCLVYSEDNQKTYYESVSDYLTKQSSGTDNVGYIAAAKFGNLYYGLDGDYEKNLPENIFLKKWKFMNEELFLVNKDGHTIDDEGRLINEDGRYVDVDGNFVDRDGNPMTVEGNYKVEVQPFLDDDGEPLEDPTAKKKPKKKSKEAVTV